MAGIQLKVEVSELKSKADEIKGYLADITKNWEQICGTVANSESYWEGEAGDQYRKYLSDNKDEAEKLLKELGGYTPKLMDMAGIYEDAEQEAKEIINQLEGDVIF